MRGVWRPAMPTHCWLAPPPITLRYGHGAMCMCASLRAMSLPLPWGVVRGIAFIAWHCYLLCCALPYCACRPCSAQLKDGRRWACGYRNIQVLLACYVISCRTEVLRSLVTTYSLFPSLPLFFSIHRHCLTICAQMLCSNLMLRDPCRKALFAGCGYIPSLHSLQVGGWNAGAREEGR